MNLIIVFCTAVLAISAFYLEDTSAVLAALAAETAIISFLAIKSLPGWRAPLFSLYRAVIAAGFALPVNSRLNLPIDIFVKAAAVLAVAAVAAVAAAALLRIFPRIPAAALVIAAAVTDIFLFFVFVPASPSLLSVPFGAGFLIVGGLVSGPLLLFFAWHLLVFLLHKFYADTENRIQCAVAALFVVIASPILIWLSDNTRLPPLTVSVLHANQRFEGWADVAFALQTLEKSPRNSLIVTPESFFPFQPERLPPPALAHITKNGNQFIVGAKFFTGEKSYRGGAFLIRNRAVAENAHYKTLLFPAEGLIGATVSGAPKTPFFIRDHEIQPLICFEVLAPFRNRESPPDMYAVLSNTEDFPPPSRRTVRLLAQALAAAARTPLALSSHQGESAVFDSAGEIITFLRTTAPPFSFLNVVIAASP